MKRAVELFTFETRSSSSPFVTATWHTQSEPETAECMISAAASQWEIVVTRQAAAVWVTVRGPETKAGPAPNPRDAEFFGIHFSHGTFMPIRPCPGWSIGP
jgi:hypothetical protein